MGFRNSSIGIGVALCCALFATPQAVSAKDGERDEDGRRGHDRERIERAYEGREAGDLKPVAELIRAVVEAYGGEVIEVELEDRNDRPVYEFHLLGKDGRLREVYVDGHDGTILAGGSDD